jgi:chitinase
MFNQRTFLSFLSLFFTLTFSFAQSLPCKEVIGYYPNWQWYDRAKLVRPTTIDYSKYTIINYAFFSPQINGTITSTDTWADENLLKGQPNWSQGGYYPNTSIVDLAHNAGVKILPSIGGWTLSNNFPSIAADATKRSTFANACVQLITEYNFDGIDIDWEYPGYAPHGGSAADKQNFTLLMQAIRNALTAKTAQTGKTYLLTACFGAAQSHINNIEWANVVPLLDCFNLMSYDFFGSWDAITNHNSPLYAPAQGDPTFNINSAVNALLNTYNVPANKICAGLAFYGRSHKTTNVPTLFGAGTGTADTQTFSDDDGSPLFYNILKKQSLFDKYTDNQAVAPYLLGKNGLKTFVSYDDTASITSKAAYIKNKNLRGCIIWEITGDYIETAVGSGAIAGTPLATAIKNVFCDVQGTVNQAPTVSISSPVANQIFTAPANITISANASDPDGTISKVEFYRATTLLGTKTNSPYTFAWNNVAAGNYSITAKAYDDKNAVTTSTAIATKVNPAPNQSPVVFFTQPAVNQNFTNPANVTIAANASDPDGTISKVEFYNGSTLLGIKTSSPYTFTWTNVAAGTYTILAKAFDNLGATAQSTVNIVVNANPNAPICAITNPKDGDVFQIPVNITININATMPIKGTTIQSVRIFSNGKPLATLNQSPYTFVWNNVAAGAYQLTAEALGSNGLSTTSKIVKFSVNSPNIPPTCSLTQPAQNQTYTAPATVNIAATATDPNGTVTKVEFYNGTTLLATDYTAPYSYVWQNVAQGVYSIKAKAFDNQGATTFSTPVNITVNQSTIPLCTQYTKYVEGSSYTNNSVVTNIGGVYKCIVAGWCSGAGWAYAPGTGTSWQAAWTKTGDCTPVLPSCTTTPAYVPNAPYQTGSVVKNNNQLFSCNIPSWCSGTASFYAPGTGSAWQSAWTLLGNCPSTMSNGNDGSFQNGQFEKALVFPNPTTDEVQVIVPNAPKGLLQINVFDMSGKLIFTKTNDNQDYEVIETLHLQHLPMGLYHLHIKTQDWQKDWLLSKI